jgi:lysophospholipid acyltransferase (LPLAT)-like uncharacterized protein
MMRALRLWALKGPGVWLAAAVNRLLARAARVRRLHVERDVEAIKTSTAVIYAFWHGRFWLLPKHLGHPGVTVLVSRSTDGEIIARILNRLGHHSVRGSSSRGGREALSGLVAVLEAGRPVAITPDGPRGPRQEAQMGAVALAARTGCPIVPVGVSARPNWTLGSWDRFQIPKPFARAVVVFGEPLRVPREGDLEPWRDRLQRALDSLQDEADRETGVL